MKKIVFIALSVLLSLSISAQNNNKPTSIEFMFGNNKVYYGLATTMPIYKNLYYNNITTAYTDYQFRHNIAELVSVNSFIYKFLPYIGLSGGTQFHFIKGIVPNIALHTSYANPDLLVLVTPYINLHPWLGTEIMTLISYRPKLSKNLKLYTKAQGLYGYNLEKSIHERSFSYLRLGLSYKKWTIGAATNFDFYGKNMAKKIENYGLFFNINL